MTFVLLILLLFLLASFPLAKQFEPETGSIQGVITDQLGPVAQASVEARDLATGTILEAESDPAGLYRLENLHPGKYSLFVHALYHDSLWIQQIPVDHGQTVQHDIFLLRTPKETLNLGPANSPFQLASR
jgi:hypothetical protein